MYGNSMNAKTNDTRQHILEVGYKLIVNKGFTAVGLSELLKAADVPKGSFYHYFKSKEQFGEALIEEYFRNYLQRIDHLFNNQELTAYQCLVNYFSMWLEVNDGVCNANKCLVVKLSAEVSDLSEAMRMSLAKGASQIINALDNCIKRGIQDGSINVQHSNQIASQLYQQWLGASLLNKLMPDQTHLELSLVSTKQLLQA